MWIFTRFGMFSVVCGKVQAGPKTGQPEPRTVLVRARARAHLTSLLEKFGSTLSKVEIQDNATLDYRFRIIISRRVWLKLAAKLADDTSYTNFKAAAASTDLDGRYSDLLHKVWSEARRFQDEADSEG